MKRSVIVSVFFLVLFYDFPLLSNILGPKFIALPLLLFIITSFYIILIHCGFFIGFGGFLCSAARFRIDGLCLTVNKYNDKIDRILPAHLSVKGFPKSQSLSEFATLYVPESKTLRFSGKLFEISARSRYKHTLTWLFFLGPLLAPV